MLSNEVVRRLCNKPVRVEGPLPPGRYVAEPKYDGERELVEDVSIRELVSEEEWDEIRARARADVPAINVSAYYPASDQFAEWLLSKIGDRLREIE